LCLVQVKTNIKSKQLITANGKYDKNYKAFIFNVSPPDTSKVTKGEVEDKKIKGGKPFGLAKVLPVSFNIVEFA